MTTKDEAIAVLARLSDEPSPQDQARTILARLSDQLAANTEARDRGREKLQADLKELAEACGFMHKKTDDCDIIVKSVSGGAVGVYVRFRKVAVSIKDLNARDWEDLDLVFVPETESWSCKGMSALVHIANWMAKSLPKQLTVSQ